MATRRYSLKRSANFSSHLDSATPPKRTLAGGGGCLPLLELPKSILMKVLQYLDINQLGIFSLASHTAQASVFDFCRTKESLPTLAQSLIPTSSCHQAGQRRVRQDFRRLGLMIKRLTCLLPTRNRLNFCSEILSILADSGARHAVYRLGAVCLHQLVNGWADSELRLTAAHVLVQFNSDLRVSRVLSLNYQLGSNPHLEASVSMFLRSTFWGEVGPGLPISSAEKMRKIWLMSLLDQVSPDRNPIVISRTLLLLGTHVKEGPSQQTVQWADHEEAIPATSAVAKSRYKSIVALLNILRWSPLSPLIPDLLSHMFQIPGPWLLENVGSVLLLLGQSTTRDYLALLVRQVVDRAVQDFCTNCFINVAIAITGLAVMTARSRGSLNPVFERLEEVMDSLHTSQQKQSMLTALWEVLAGELTDLRQSAEEDWAQEGGMYLFQVIRMVGKDLTEKAYSSSENSIVENEE
jgi:hypothetical protein